MQTLAQDVRYALRTLSKSPGFAVVAVLTLGLGIGADTAVFSVVDAVLLEPLPYRDPERLVLIWERMRTTGFDKAPVSAPDVVDYRAETTLFDGIAATNNVAEVALVADGVAEQIKVAGVTANFFAVLGVEPLLGRDFAAADEVPIPPELFQDPTAEMPATAVLLTYRYWQRRFGGDRAVLGRVLKLGGPPIEVVGVLPPDFELLMPVDAGMPTDVDAYQPLRIDLAAGSRDNQFLRVIGRLAPGVTPAAAQAEMDALAARQREQFLFHRNMGMEIRVEPMHADVVHHVRPVLLALFGAVAFVLLIACANVASLLLARAAGRRREMAVRSALGASRGRLMGQVLVEGALLAGLGGALGVLLARAGIELLLALRPANLPRADAVSIDARVLAFTLGATAFAALVFALVPALRSSRPRAAEVLRQRAATGATIRLRSVLVVGEVALSLVLLIGAGLMLRTFAALGRIQPGFRPAGVLTYALSLPFDRYGDPASRVRFYQEMEAEVAALPGVTAVGSVFPMPLGGRFWTGPYGREGEAEEEWTKHEANFRVASAGYFEAMGTRLLAGRALTAADAVEDRDVAVVDLLLANRVWGDRSPIGERLGVDVFGQKRWLEVVGVVEHVRHDDLTHDGRPTIYFTQTVLPWPPMTVAVRAGADPGTLTGPIRALVADLDPEVPIYRVRPLAAYVTDAEAPTRFTLVVIGLFGLVATVLAAIGLFGVLAYTVRQRTREIGVRLALGAEKAAILRLILGRGLGLALVGVALGLLAAVAATRILAGLLVGVTTTDPLTYASLAALLVGVASIATWLPAHQATEVEPVVSLRVE